MNRLLDISMRFIAICMAIALCWPNCMAQENATTSKTDSIDVADSNYSFHVNQIIAPAALVGTGTLGVWCFKGFKDDIRDGMQSLRGEHSVWKGDNILQYVPAGAYLGLGAVGVKGRHGIVDRMIIEATAYATMTALTNSLKYTVREPRPDTGARNSFPSGHSATVFTGAELIRIEYGWAWGAGAYAIAATVGFMRMYNDRHWYNDVLAGAGIGILSARIGYWMLPVLKRLFTRRPAAVAFSPYCNPTTRSAGLSFAACF